MKNFLKGFGLGLGLFVFFVLGLISTKAYELLSKKDGLKITRNIEVSKTINYDAYLAYPKFSASKMLSTKEDLSDEQKTSITTLFSKILERVKQTNICTGGSYTLQPNIAYKDGLSVPSGYSFDSNFECRFNKEQFSEYQTLLKDINNILANNEFIVLNIPAIRSTVSDKTSKAVQEQLYDEAYVKATKLAKHYSEKTNKICEINNITYGLNAYPTKLAYADVTYNLPIEKDAIQRLKAIINYECK